ncbi:hypothetical protein QVD17_09127 [Tagetes erecta]|uniref:Uncharacterized protein n=1 Tax=Tagetes erecta TaxID=13708 RepID=A0AAD8L3A5_TARER|nr:hypothetical protein QVD17_09127 [Tagetes erecta]
MGRQSAHFAVHGGGGATHQALSNPNFLLNGYSNLEHGSGSHIGSTNSQHNPSLGFSSPQGPTSQINGQSTNFQGVLGPGPLPSPNSTNFLGFGTMGQNNDTSQFGQSHFASWASDPSPSCYGLTATLSDVCQTVESWIPDSGATAHMTSDFSVVRDAVPYTVMNAFCLLQHQEEASEFRCYFHHSAEPQLATSSLQVEPVLQLHPLLKTTTDRSEKDD